MDSKSRRLPFTLSSTTSSYSSPSPFSSSSSSLGTSRLYGRGSVLSSDRLRSSSALKPDLTHQTSRFLSSSRDYSVGGGGSSNSSGGRTTAPNWKLPSPLSTSSLAYDRSWAASSLSSRSKLTDSERRLGTYSGLLGTATDDGDSKRAKMSYTNRAAYTRTPSSSSSTTSSSSSSSSTVTGSSYSSSRLGTSGTDSSWRSYRPLSRSSSSSSSSSSSDLLWSRRELEKRSDVGSLSSGLGESCSLRSPSLSSSLYRPDRVTSTYAQGARPKETLYSSTTTTTSSSSSSSARDHSSYSRHVSSAYLPSPLTRDSGTRTTNRSSASSATLRSPLEPTGGHELSPAAPTSSSSRPSSWYTSALARQDPSPSPAASSTHAPPVPRPAPEGGESDGRRSTRRLLSRLFSRRSSQDSSSGSSSSSNGARSFDSTDEGPSGTAAGEGDAEEAARTAVEADSRGSEAAQAFAFLRRRRQGLSPVQESQSQPAQPSLDTWAAPNSTTSSTTTSSSSSSSSSSTSSWLSSSLRSRCTPLFSRRRREGRDESARSATGGSAEGYEPSSQYPLRRRDNPEEEEEEEEEEGAVGVAAAAAGAASARAALEEELRAASRSQQLARVMNSPMFRVRDNVMIAVDMTGSARSQPEGQEKDKPAPSRDPERLRKIQESLLLEDSDEEEGDRCRICQMGEECASNPLIEPCCCTGSLQYVHQDCIKKWLHSKISSGTNLDAITTCELCKEKLHLNIENFDVNELYRTHERSEYEFISCGLYLVVLLHLCEQRFSDVLGAANDAGFFNLARTLHEHMDNLESSYGDSDEEVVDTRPSIDFSDLDDDLEEEY